MLSANFSMSSDRHARAVQHRDQDVRVRRVLRIVQVLATLDAATTADQRLRQRIVVVGVAVGHVAAEQDDRMVEHRPVAVGHLVEALDELREHRGVVVLDEPQVGDAFRESTPVRGRVERFVDAQVRVGPHAGFLDHLHRGHSGPIRLPGQGDHLELNVEELTEILRRTERRTRQIVAATWRSPRASARAARSRGPNPGNRSPWPGQPASSVRFRLAVDSLT